MKIIVVLVILNLAILGYILYLYFRTSNGHPSSYPYIKYPDTAYRLGDCVLVKKHRQKMEKWLNIKYPDSIAAEYTRRTGKMKDLDTLLHIVKEKEHSVSLPDTNTLVIHLRTGDIIDKTKHSAQDFLDKDIITVTYGTQYVYPLSYYETALKFFQPFKFKKVVIITGFHYKHNYDKSLEYTKGVETFFKDKGFDVSVYINRNADEDFMYMVNSKYFIKSGGGFSELISSLVKLKGGHVFELK